MNPDLTALYKKQYEEGLTKLQTLSGRLDEIDAAKQQVMPEALKRVGLSNRLPMEDPSASIRALTSIQGSPYQKNTDAVELQLKALAELRAAIEANKEGEDSLSQVDLQKEYLKGNGKVKYDPKTGKLSINYDQGEGKSGIDTNSPESKEAATKLRTEYTNQSKTNGFIEVKNQYDKIKTAPDTAAGDLSLIFAYMKILDPNSTVREGEFANAQNTAGVPGQIVNAYNKALSGKRLNSTQRQEFKSAAAQTYNSHVKTQKQLYNFYKNQAEEMGLDPDDVLGAFGEINEEIAQQVITPENPGFLNFIFQPQQTAGFSAQLQPNKVGRFIVEVE